MNRLDAAWEFTRQISPRRIVRAADTVSGSGEILNTYSRVHPVAGATPLVPWAVYLTDAQRRFRLVLIDFDAKNSPRTAAKDCAALRGMLDSLGIAYVECASAGLRAGGRHVWIALAEAIDPAEVSHLAHLLQRTFDSFDPTPLLNPATGAGRPPGAPHRRGGVSRVLKGELDVLRHPTTTSCDLHALRTRLRGLAADVETRLETTSPRSLLDDGASVRLGGPRRPLSAQTRALLDAQPAQNASASLWAILCAAARAAWSLAEVSAELLDRPGLEHARTKHQATGVRLPRPSRGTNSPHAVLDRMWTKAVAWVSQHPATGADPTFDSRADAIAQLAWELQRRADSSPGRWATSAGVVDRLVLDQITCLALDAVSPEIEASIRTVAERIGVDRETTRCALNRLVEDGWLSRTRTTSGRRAAYYTIDAAGVFHTLQQKFLSQADAPPAGRATLQQTLHDRAARVRFDVFAPRCGLGRRLGLLYARLHEADSPFRMAQLAGLGEAKVREKFERLATHGLAQHRLDGTWARSEPSPARRDALATSLGSAGYLERMKAQHVVERAMWSWWCAELEWMRAPRSRRARPGTRRASALQVALVPDRHDNIYGAHPRRSGRADFAAARRIVLEQQRDAVAA